MNMVMRTWTRVRAKMMDRSLEQVRGEAASLSASLTGDRAWDQVVGQVEGLVRDEALKEINR